MSRPLTFIALFAVGAFVMFAFESVFTLALGMALQVAAIILGVFTIATPEFLSGDRDD
jgi:multisubunit Na+/H+ antiporter MnhC subunit